MYLVIPGIVAVASWLELMFVNGMGLPYHIGLIVYVIILILRPGVFGLLHP